MCRRAPSRAPARPGTGPTIVVNHESPRLHFRRAPPLSHSRREQSQRFYSACPDRLAPLGEGSHSALADLAALPQLALLFSGGCNAPRTVDQQFDTVKCRWGIARQRATVVRNVARRWAAAGPAGPDTGSQLCPTAYCPLPRFLPVDAALAVAYCAAAAVQHAQAPTVATPCDPQSASQTSFARSPSTGRCPCTRRAPA